MSIGAGNDHKSVFTDDRRIKYCTEISIQPHALQTRLTAETVAKNPMAVMLGAPEALHLCSSLIKLIKGRRCLDIGLFTGSSALAWALAVPADGEVVCLDVQRRDYDATGKGVVDSDPALAAKIKIRVKPALQSLDELIAEGQTGSFDFAFLDAAKTEYPAYYDKCMELVRPGGIIVMDNALMGGAVYREEKSSGRDDWSAGAKIVDELNRRIHEDDRVENDLIGMADGIHIIFKK